MGSKNTTLTDAAKKGQAANQLGAQPKTNNSNNSNSNNNSSTSTSKPVSEGAKAGGAALGKGAATSTTTSSSGGPTAAAAAAAASAGPSKGTGVLSNYARADDKLTIESFNLLKVVGRGSFGKVMLVSKTDNPKRLFAMKVLKKAVLLKRNQIAHTETERYILENIHSPFIIQLHFAFQNTEKLYMVMDFLAGGELFHWLRKDKRFDEPRARLYAAEITCALEALHTANIIYRDLKTENIMLDAQGHLRLVDFGLAKGGVTGPGAEGGTKTFCGTPEYLAPEILENKGHGKAVDWWALGTLLFEMLTGLPPFYDNNVQKMYHKILHDPLRFPKADQRQVSENAKDILRRLLERKISDRLGSGGAHELKATPFFAVYDFNQVIAKAYDPPFKPPFDDPSNATPHVDREFAEEAVGDSVDTRQLTNTMQEKTKFEGFTFDGK